jgi:peptidyl-prolyl cis-trans isomerase B (cyclophilin B)
MNASPLVSLIMSLFSVILPSKMWYTPTQPMAFSVDAKTPVTLMLTKFNGEPVSPQGSAGVAAGGKVADLKSVFPSLTAEPGTYVLFAVPKGKKVADFVGTPVVIEGRVNKEPGAPRTVMVFRLQPLRYAVMTTTDGAMTMAFYYDVAPNTTESFINLSSQGYYDGLTFHRVMSDFMLQAGDPSGNGSGGPGFTVNQEFNDRKHVEGVLSMAREGSPGEQYGQPPTDQAANSAGSQFFICLNYQKTQGLDGKYTAFGKVVDGEKTMQALKATPVVAGDNGELSKPVKPPVIDKVEVFPVTPGHNPYAEFGLGK